MSTYVMSDIHGCYDEFLTMLRVINYNDSDLLVLAGDYIDRGLKSLEMLQWIKHNISDRVIVLRGNHEEEFCGYLNLLCQINTDNNLDIDYSSSDDCMALYDSCIYLIKQKNPLAMSIFDIYGTIYDLIFNKKVCINELIQYCKLIKNMPFYYWYNQNTVIVHAGYIDSAYGSTKNVENFYLYARDENYTIGGLQGGTVIFGHTPTVLTDERCYNDGDIYHYFDEGKQCHYYNIDCGIVYRYYDNPSGQLGCLRLEDKECFYV